MKYLILTFAFLLTGIMAFGQSKRIITTDASKINYYPDIVYLNEGEPAANGKIYRAIITLSEVYNSLIIETLTVGDEGGNVKIVSRRKVDLDGLWSAFNLQGEVAGLNFVKWQSPTAFIITIYDKKFAVSDIGAKSISVSAE